MRPLYLLLVVLVFVVSFNRPRPVPDAIVFDSPTTPCRGWNDEPWTDGCYAGSMPRPTPRPVACATDSSPADEGGIVPYLVPESCGASDARAVQGVFAHQLPPPPPGPLILEEPTEPIEFIITIKIPKGDQK